MSNVVILRVYRVGTGGDRQECDLSLGAPHAGSSVRKLVQVALAAGRLSLACTHARGALKSVSARVVLEPYGAAACR